MPTPAIPSEEIDRRISCIEKHLQLGRAPMGISLKQGEIGAVRVAAEELGINASSLCRLVKPGGTFETKYGRSVRWDLWNQKSKAANSAGVETSRFAKRYLITSAQDETHVHRGFWSNLQAYARFLDAEIIVGGFTYNKSLFEDHDHEHGVFASEVRPHMCLEQRILAPRLKFCGEMNILPTAATPLSGLQSYTGDAWGIFPHAKIQLESIPRPMHAPPKQNVTTGVCTVENYVKKKAGLIATFHHIIGALIVEVCGDDTFFVRQICADDETGDFQDLDTQVRAGRVSNGHRVEAITYGDIHRMFLRDEIALPTWGFSVSENRSIGTPGNMLDTLRPMFQFFHDTLDFRIRNHHSRNDPHHAFQMHVNRTESIRQEVADCTKFLLETQRDWCRSVVIESNHDTALVRWLKETSYKDDPANAVLWLELQLAAHKAMENGRSDFNIVECALRGEDHDGLPNVEFVPEGDGYIICQGHGGIECSFHGHKGSGGARGSARQFARSTSRSNTAHTHSPAIFEGNYCAGHSCDQDMVFNRGGLSSWAHAHTITYPNAKRTLVTMQNGRWRA